MTEKRFTIIDGIKKGTHSGIWDNQKQNNQRIGDELWVGEVVAMLNEGVMIVEENEQLKSENDSYKNMFFEIVETALTDKNCRELYCKGILDIFDKANSLNQAREMIKEHLK